MGGAFGIVLQAGILWFLITFFTRQANSVQSWREAKIVLIGVLFVTILSRLLLLNLLGPLVLLIEAAALYLLVDKVCETSQRVTIKICVWYFAATLVISGFFYLLSNLMNQ